MKSNAGYASIGLLLLALSAFAPQPGRADCLPQQTAKLLASDAAAEDYFGYSVAISGDTVVVGAYGKASNAGAAYVFARNQGGADKWSQVTKRVASDPVAGDRFGASVAISGDTLVVGAPAKASDAGAAYVFARNWGGGDAWGQVARLVASDAAAGDEFGASVAISGDTLAVGTPAKASEAGVVYAFARNLGGADRWGQLGTLTAFEDEPPEYSSGVSARSQGIQAGARFGQSVAMDGDLLAAGAPGEDVQESDAGAAYGFGAKGTWQEVAIPRASDAAADDTFGASVALSGDTLVAGAPGEDSGGSGAGAAYIFARNVDGADAWGQVTRLVASDPVANDAFGASVAMDSDTLVVGARGKASNAGAAYVFARNRGGPDAWGQVIELAPSDLAAGDSFGNSVSISGDTLVVGAYNQGAQAGAAYVFARNWGGADAWGQVTKLGPAEPAAGDYFGIAVAISGDHVVAGAPRKGSAAAGTAHVFARDQNGQPDGWQGVSYRDDELNWLYASDATPDAWFGHSVAISRDRLVVGADYKASQAGAAYVFTRRWGWGDNWDMSPTKKLVASDAAAGDHFGASVAMDGDTLVVGAPYNRSSSGAAYVFTLGSIERFLPVIFRH